MTRFYLLLAAAVVIAIGFTAGPASATACYDRAEDGTCLDDVVPQTGQYTSRDTHADELPEFNLPEGIRPTQAHGAVRLREATYVDAHDICRLVDNKGSRGRALFIGLETRAEWASLALSDTLPQGVEVTPCCRPVAVEVCGTQKQIGYSKVGEQVTVTGGRNRLVQYVCSGGTTGSVPTYDTSWTVASNGQCQAPADGGDAPSNEHDTGPKSGHNGQGGGKGADGSRDHGDAGNRF